MNASSGTGGMASRARAAGEAGGVGLRPEGRDAAVGLGVGLEALEDRLGVVQRRGRRVQLQRRVGGQPGVVPALARCR